MQTTNTAFNAELSSKMTAPVELDLAQLELVSGAGPKGGWIIQPPDLVAQSLAVEAPGPKGGW